MVRQLIYIVIALALMGNTIYEAPYFIPMQTAFEDACERTTYDCTDVPVPKLRIGSLAHYGIPGANGVYTGGDTIYLDLMAGKPYMKKYATALHEIVHYLQSYAPNRIHLLPGCFREGEAFFVANAVLSEFGFQDYVFTDWYRAYNRCGPQHIVETKDQLVELFSTYTQIGE